MPKKVDYLYYDPQRLFSYNRSLNMVVSQRGLGKTYSLTKHVINRFLKYGEQFVYIRRYKTDFEKLDTFFDDMIKNDEFHGHDFSVNGRELIIDKAVTGHAIPLSTEQSKKSVSFPNVTTIIFDEFLASKGTLYLPDEPTKLMSLCDTIIRGRENCRIVLLANSISIANPYFLYFDIQPDLNREFTIGNNPQIIIQIPSGDAAKEARLQTKFGQLISHTPYGSYSLDNEFLEDNSDFIEARTPTSNLIAVIAHQNELIGFWTDMNEGKIYASKKIDPNYPRIAITTKDHRLNTLLIDNYKKNSRLNYILRSFRKGYLYFEDQDVKHNCMDVFKHFNIR